MFGLIGSILGGVSSLLGANEAKNAQEYATERQINAFRNMRATSNARFKPYLKGGQQGFNALRYEMGLTDKMPGGYSGYQASPGYAYQMDQGREAVMGANAFRGGLNSGATLKALTAFGQNLADQDRNAYLDRLTGIGNMGFGAAGSMANIDNAFANGVATAYGARGNAQAAGAVGMSNAINDTIGNVAGLGGFGGGANTSGMGWGNWRLGG